MLQLESTPRSSETQHSQKKGESSTKTILRNLKGKGKNGENVCHKFSVFSKKIRQGSAEKRDGIGV